MSRTYRNRHKHTHYISEAEMMKRVYCSWRTGEVEPFYDAGTWDKYARDGYWKDGRRKYFRQLSNELIRNQTRVDMQKIKGDPEHYDNMSFATQWDGKRFIWSVW